VVVTVIVILNGRPFGRTAGRVILKLLNRNMYISISIRVKVHHKYCQLGSGNGMQFDMDSFCEAQECDDKLKAQQIKREKVPKIL